MNWIARIVMGLLGLGFLAALLLGLLCYIVFAMLRWLLTGRKPQVVMVWQQFSAMRQNFRAGGFRAGSDAPFQDPRARQTPYSRDEQVVDVEVREVVEDAPRLPSDRRH
jgi:hypothetical protein